MLPLDAVDGTQLDLPASGRMEVGASYLSGAMHIPRAPIRVSVDIRAVSVSGTPTLTVKIRQGNSASPTPLVDRAVTSPAALAAFSGAARALMVDDVVANYVEFEIVCTGGSADVVAIATAR